MDLIAESAEPTGCCWGPTAAAAVSTRMFAAAAASKIEAAAVSTRMFAAAAASKIEAAAAAGGAENYPGRWLPWQQRWL